MSKQQKLDADLKVIQQINFTRNLDRIENTTIVFNIEEEKLTNLDFFTRKWESIVNLFYFNINTK